MYDESLQLTIASHDADEPRPMASTTKLMTALLTIENTGPDEEVVISRRAEQTNFKQIGLVTGQTWTVGELGAVLLVDYAFALSLRLYH